MQSHEENHRFVSPKDFIYRTEVYLQQREQHRSASNVTTWKDLMQQKQLLQHEQAEIDRALSMMDSIHNSLNRSLMIPYDRVYARLYGGGDEDESSRLLTSFCQRRDHCRHFYLLSTSTNLADDLEDLDPDCHTDAENGDTKKSYDSGYGSMLIKRRLRREPITKLTQSSIVH